MNTPHAELYYLVTTWNDHKSNLCDMQRHNFSLILIPKTTTLPFWGRQNPLGQRVLSYSSLDKGRRNYSYLIL